jgi:hypothetical protein
MKWYDKTALALLNFDIHLAKFYMSSIVDTWTMKT